MIFFFYTQGRIYSFHHAILEVLLPSHLEVYTFSILSGFYVKLNEPALT